MIHFHQSHYHTFKAYYQEHVQIYLKTLNNALLNVVAGNVTHAGNVEDAVKGHEMVFCTLGADNRGVTTLYSVAARTITQAMNNKGVRRLMFLSNFGVLGETSSNFRTAFTVMTTKLFLHGVISIAIVGAVQSYVF